MLELVPELDETTAALLEERELETTGLLLAGTELGVTTTLLELRELETTGALLDDSVTLLELRELDVALELVRGTVAKASATPW